MRCDRRTYGTVTSVNKDVTREDTFSLHLPRYRNRASRHSYIAVLSPGRLQTKGDLMISFASEKDLELLLFDNKEWLIANLGICPDSKFYRQVNIAPYGIMDILVISESDGHVSFTIIELKNQNITRSDMAQLSRYMRYFEILESNLTSMVGCRGILLGPESFTGTQSDDVFLAQNLSEIDVYSLKIDPMSGLSATLIQDWRLAEEHDFSAIISLLEDSL